MNGSIELTYWQLALGVIVICIVAGVITFNVIVRGLRAIGFGQRPKK